MRAPFCVALLALGACAGSGGGSGAHAALTDVGDSADALLPRMQENGSDAQRAALSKLADDGADSDTLALIVVHRGKTILDLHRPGTAERLFPLMSITKMVTAMAIGHLIADGRLTLATPLGDFFPEWREGAKARVTIEHLLRHNSGLPHIESAAELNAAPDAVAYARALPLETEPGGAFAYSNEGAALLAGVVRIASGVPLDVYVRDRVLRPLGIARYDWGRDRSGTPHAYADLRLRPHDLVRVGQMMLRGGTWQDARVLPEGWALHMVEPNAPAHGGHRRYGLLTEVFRDRRYKRATATIAFGHTGSRNQYLFIAPRSELVVVRTRDATGDDPVPMEADLLQLAEAFEPSG